MIKSILLSTIVLNVGLLLGRLSGFVRESIVATTYGTSSQADIVVLMLTVPDLLVNILVGGAMGAVLIPEFNSSSGNAKKLLFQNLYLQIIWQQLMFQKNLIYNQEYEKLLF